MIHKKGRRIFHLNLRVIIACKILRLIHSTALFYNNVYNFAVIPLLFSKKKKLTFLKRDQRMACHGFAVTISVITLQGIINIRVICHFRESSFGKSRFTGINKITIDEEKANNFRFYGKDIRAFTENYGNTLYHPHDGAPQDDASFLMTPISESCGAVVPKKTASSTATFGECHM